MVKQAISMRTFWCQGMMVLLMGLVAGPASAGLCQAPFMHDGGQVQLTGSGGLQLGADLAFSEVSQQGNDHCDARRSEERRVGKGFVSTCISRGSPYL